MSEKLYTTAEVAEVCRVQKETIREWIKLGKMKGEKRGRQYLINESELTRFLEAKHG